MLLQVFLHRRPLHDGIENLMIERGCFRKLLIGKLFQTLDRPDRSRFSIRQQLHTRFSGPVHAIIQRILLDLIQAPLLLLRLLLRRHLAQAVCVLFRFRSVCLQFLKLLHIDQISIKEGAVYELLTTVCRSLMQCV